MTRRMVVDIGNSRQKIGLFSDDQLVIVDSVPSEGQEVDFLDRWAKNFKPDQIGIANTIQLSESIENWMEQNKVCHISASLNLPFKLEYKTPETLGADRLAAVSGAYSLFSGENVLVIDAGTCITYDFINKEKHYLGGNISPGIQMRLASMHYYTDRLPRVFLDGEIKWIGQSTEEALRAGGVIMAIMEAQGFITYLNEQFGEMKVILTGGGASYFQNYLTGKKFVEPHLVLLGINEILKNNEV